MNILIVNAFGNSLSGKNKFYSFLSLIKSTFKKVSENSGIEKFNFIIRTPLTIGDFTYNSFTNPFEETSESKSRKNFNSLDMVFIDGTELYLPWKEKSEKLFEFIKLCKSSNKVLFAGGVALQILIYYLSIGSMAEYSIINCNGEIKSLEELNKFPLNYFKGTKTSELFLDYVTGDLLGYREYINSWEPIMNIGLHHQIYAEKYINRGKFVLEDAFKSKNEDNNLKKISHSFYFMKNVISSEIKVKVNKQCATHYLLKNCSSEFNALCSLEWFPHFNNVSSKKYQFRIICISNRGPSIIEHENTVGVLFHSNPKFWDSAYVLKNFIYNKFNEVKDKLLGVKNIYNIDQNQQKDNSLYEKFFGVNKDNMLKREYENEEKSMFIGYKTGIIDKVSKSCLFNKARLVKHEAKHVGNSINNREMIFVENNYINQKIFSRMNNKINIIKNINNKSSSKNKDEHLSLTQRDSNKKSRIISSLLLKKNYKGSLNTYMKIKKANKLFLKNPNNLDTYQNRNNKSQKIKLKHFSEFTKFTNIENKNIKKKILSYSLNTDRKKDLKKDKENKDNDDLTSYRPKYPRLPTLLESEKIKKNNMIKMMQTKGENENEKINYNNLIQNNI